jgi:hypothetical protein
MSNARGLWRALYIAPFFLVGLTAYLLACPTSTVVGAGTVTAPSSKDGAIVKRNRKLLTTNTNTQNATECSGKHELDVPDPATPEKYIVWAVAGISGFTGIFYGNSATATFTHTYQYNVACGPCPVGTNIAMTLEGDAKWLQFVAAAGAAKLTGSGSSTVTGTLTVDPFPVSPINVGATPATVTASAAVGIATAGSELEKTTPFASAKTEQCPLNNQDVVVTLTVTASRTGGVVTSTSSFNSLDSDVETKCACPAPPSTESSTTEDAANETGGFSIPNPTSSAGLVVRAVLQVDHPEALVAVGNGELVLAEALSPASPTAMLGTGPRTRLRVYDGSSLTGTFAGERGLVSSILETNPANGEFLALEGIGWDPTQFVLDPQVTELKTVDANGVVATLVLGSSLFAPSAIVSDGSSGYFVTLPDSGGLAHVSAIGTVTALTGFDYGTPVDLCWDPPGSKLYVLDFGTYSGGVVQMGTGRVLEVDTTSGNVTTFLSGLDTPVALFFGDGGFYGESGQRLYVLSTGDVDPITGLLNPPATGTLTAYDAVGLPDLLLEQIDSPYDAEFRTPAEITIASSTRLMDVSWQSSGSAGYCTAGTSANGCNALISASGTASATASSGFSLTSSGVEGAKDGLYFFGTSGRQANPWGSGTSYQCVVPPVKRGGLLSGVGTAGGCDGSFTQDLNAFWCPTCPRPLHNPGAGALVQAQLWYRDPFNTSNQTTSLSDAIEFQVGP